MTDKALIGIVGAGWWATDTHIPALRNHPQAEIIALCDTDPARLQAAATSYDIPHTYTDLSAMLAGQALDGVVIVSSNASHYAVAKACLEQGLHVMLEKPMTLYAAGAKALVALAEQQQRQLISGYPFNFTPFAIRSRDVIAADELGAVQHIDLIYNSYMTPLFTGANRGQYRVHGPRQYTEPEQLGGGHGQVQITHAAGLLFHVTGLRPRRVFALMQRHGLAVDLVDVMMVEFEGGALGTVSGSGNHKGLTFRLQVNCERGSIDIDARKGVALIQRNDRDDVEPVTYDEASDSTPRSHATARNLVDVILGTADNGSSAETGWRAVELLDAAYRSAAQDGAPVLVSDLYRAA